LHGAPHSFPPRRSSDLVRQAAGPARTKPGASDAAAGAAATTTPRPRPAQSATTPPTPTNRAPTATTKDPAAGGYRAGPAPGYSRSEEHTSELQSRFDLV